MDPALSRRTIDALGGSIVSIYGLTETGAADFFRMPQQAGDLALGRTAAGVTFRIQTLAENSDIGELQIHSPNGMVGYLDAPALTEAAYDDIYLKTGDLARRRSDGEIEIVGRLKDLIIRGAMKISPAEIDTALATHPAVAAAISVGVPDPLVGERIHVAVVPRPGTAAAAEDIKKWATEALGRHRSPDEIHFFPELPVGRTGKSDRLAVRDAILGKIR
jgi:acyl-coenzyme A synthetase/AMP-(fatty) acid ligase